VRLALSEIGPEGERVELAWPADLFPPPGWGGQAGEADLRVVGPVSGELEIHREDSRFRLRGRIATRIAWSCHRCLKEVEEPVELALDLVMVESFEVERAEYELKPEDLDEGLIEGPEMDLVQIVWEQLILSRPMVSLCRPDCRGLCPRCGADLNTDVCRCDVKEIDPRLAVLSQWSPAGKDD